MRATSFLRLSAGLTLVGLGLPMWAEAQPYRFSAPIPVPGPEPGSADLKIPRVRRAGPGFVVVGHRTDVAAAVFDPTGNPLGASFTVNTYTTAYQEHAAIAAYPNGSFVVAWESRSTFSPQDGSGTGIFAQRFDASADPVGTEFRVNAYTTGDQSRPSIANLADGGFVVAWRSDHDVGTAFIDRTDIYARRFDASGTPVDVEFRVNEYTTGRQEDPDVVARASGGFAVVWGSEESFSPPPPGRDAEGVHGRLFDADGVSLGSEFPLNAFTTGEQRRPRLVELPSGDVMVAWESFDGSIGHGVYARLLGPTGAPVTSDIAVGGGQRLTDVALLDDGDVLVLWEGLPGTDGDARGPFARRYDPSGAPTGGEFRLSPQWRGEQLDPSAAADGNGGFFVVWDGSPVRAMHACVDLSADADGDGIGDACDPCDNPGARSIARPKLVMRHGQRADADGLSFAGEFALPAGLGFAALDPSVTPLRVRVQAGTGLVPIDVTVPTGTYAGSGTAGWTLQNNGTRWRFRDQTGTPANGIVAVKLDDRSRRTPGTARIKIKGNRGEYPMHPDYLVLNLTLGLGDGAAGECVESDFVAAECFASGFGARYLCRR